MIKKLSITLCLLIASVYLMPEPVVIPVKGATTKDWHPKSFWYEPWGTSGTHKGVDIFAANGTPVLAATHMLIVYKGVLSKGGNVVLGLGPKWRLHYFAHLEAIDEQLPPWVAAGESIGSVGDSGNAKGKQAHLHYSLVSMLPLPWRIDDSTQGYKKAFFLNPIDYILSQ